MWAETLIDKLTCFLPRPSIIRLDEGGFRQVPKPWKGWPWAYWPWIRKKWLRRPWSCWPWSPRDNESNTWIIELIPGNWYWIIPLFMEHVVIPIKVQIKDIRIQSVRTKDGVDLSIGGAIKYYVQKPIKAILDVTDYDESLQTAALVVIRKFVSQYTLLELDEKIEELNRQLLSSVREESSGWGLRVQSVEITDIGKSINLRLMGNVIGG